MARGETRFFNSEKMEEDIRYKCEIQKVNILDLFTYFDDKKEYYFHNVQNLDYILKLIGIVGEPEDTELLFRHYIDPNNDKIMRFMGLIRKIMKPSEIWKSVCLNILRVS